MLEDIRGKEKKAGEGEGVGVEQGFPGMFSML